MPPACRPPALPYHRGAARFAIGLLLLLLALSPAALAGPGDGLPPLQLDLSTPRRAMTIFLQAARAGDFLRAAHALDLRALPRDSQPTEGPRLARELFFVLGKELPLDPADLSDTPEGDPSDGARTERVGVIPQPIGVAPVTLTRVQADGDQRVWVVSAATVSSVSRLYALYGPAWIETHLPQVLSTVQLFSMALWQWIGLLGLALVSYLGGRLIGRVLLGLGKRVVARTRTPWDDRLLLALSGPTRHLLALVLFWTLLDRLRLSAGIQEVVVQGLQTLLIFIAAWLLIRALNLLALALEERAQAESQQAEGENRLRELRTQLAVLHRIVAIGIGVMAVALALLQFRVVRNVGVSLLASAGIAGVVLGFAAQRTLGTLLVGIQLSIAQPVRIGDTVVIEGEWGQVEQINLTFLVVKTWDERRLVVPVDRFLEKPFQNWSLGATAIAGIVLLHADYRLPVDAMRAELARLLDGNQLWDGRKGKVQVTELTEHTMQVRVFLTAADPDRLWDLRCQIREALVMWLREFEGGRYLPLLRLSERPERAAPTE